MSSQLINGQLFCSADSFIANNLIAGNFRAPAAQQNLAAGAALVLPYRVPAASLMVNNGVTVDVANNDIIIPVSGTYNIVHDLSLGSGGNPTTYSVTLSINGVANVNTGLTFADFRISADAEQLHPMFSTIRLSAGDKLRFTLTNSGAQNLIVFPLCSLSIQLV